MKITLATQNRDKIKEIEAYFFGLGADFLSLADVGEINLKEEGKTLRANALQKAETAAASVHDWALADDTGLFVDALQGEPGVYSARYAGENATYRENVEKLLRELEGVPEGKRGAYFSCVMALYHPDGREAVVEGRLGGVIALAPKGENGFGYDPVFLLPERGCTLAELPLKEKNKISHRGRALFKMRGVLEGLLKMGAGEEKMESRK